MIKAYRGCNTRTFVPVTTLTNRFGRKLKYTLEQAQADLAAGKQRHWWSHVEYLN